MGTDDIMIDDESTLDALYDEWRLSEEGGDILDEPDIVAFIAFLVEGDHASFTSEAELRRVLAFAQPYVNESELNDAVERCRDEGYLDVPTGAPGAQAALGD